MRRGTHKCLLCLCFRLCYAGYEFWYFAQMRWRSIGPPRSDTSRRPRACPAIRRPTTRACRKAASGRPPTAARPGSRSSTTCTSRRSARSPSRRPIRTIVYVGTGNQSGWSFTTGKGIYKSTDAGKTWTNIGLAASQYIGGIVVDPRNADTVLVAALGPRRGRGGARRRADAADANRRGASAASIDRPTAAARGRACCRPTDRRARPTSTSTIAIRRWSTRCSALAACRRAAARGAGGTGAYKSTDGGVDVAAGRRPRPAGRRAHLRVCGRVGHARPAAVRASPGRRRPRRRCGRGLYRSDDGGDTWTFGTRQLASAGGKMYADPQNPDVVYLMGTAIYRSTDGGQHVAAFWGAPSGADPRFLWIDPTNSKRMIAGVDQGAAISVDGGESWTPYYGLVNGQFYRVVDRLRLSRTTSAARSRTRARRASRAAATSARSGRTTGIRPADSRTDS